jgi:hypothetical protein
MPMDEHLFLQPAPQTAGPVLPEFCLGVVRVQEVKKNLLLSSTFCGLFFTTLLGPDLLDSAT